MKTSVLILVVLALTACQNYRAPRVNATPSSMSSDTLCFRYANNKDPELGAEIDRRNLDCAATLRDDPLFSHRSDLGNAHRMGR